MRSWISAGAFLALVACSDSNPAAPGGGAGGGDAGLDASDGGPTVPGQPDTRLSIAPVAGTLSLLPGQTATVKVTLTRGADQASAVKITVTGLPSGFTPPELTIPGNASTGDLSIVVPATPTPGAVKAQIVATSAAPVVSAQTPLSALVHGKPGDPDTTFGTNGKSTDVLTSPPARVSKLVSAPDGSFYALGETGSVVAASHLASDGKRDAAYGGGTLALGVVGGAAVQKDGKLVVVGTSTGGGAIGRFDATGKPENGFTAQVSGTGTNVTGTGGLTGSNTINTSVGIRDSDGAIFVAFDNDDSGTAKVGQLRFETNGLLHVAYGAGGGVRHINGFANGLIVRNNPASPSLGSVTVASVGQGFYAFTQQTGDDATDAKAGTQPRTTSTAFLTTRGLYARPLGLVELPDGSTVMPIDDDGSFYLRKFDPVGNAPATTFGTGGLAGPFSFGSSLASGIVAQPDGKLLVMALGGLMGTIFRFLPDGTIDTGFGSGGSITFAFNNNYPPSFVAGADRIIVSYVDSTTTTSTLASFWQ